MLISGLFVLIMALLILAFLYPLPHLLNITVFEKNFEEEE